MSYRNREIESKLVVEGRTLTEVNEVLADLFRLRKTRAIFGSSVDTYWRISNPDVEADFIRMRERDGIRQVTVKGRDKGTNIDRLEVDIDSTSDVSKIVRLLTAAHGRPIGRIGKTYYVYWPEKSEHTTVCCYSVSPDSGPYPHIIVEVEGTSLQKVMDLEHEVVTAFWNQDINIELAPGSLFQMFLSTTNSEKGNVVCQ